MTGVNSSLPRIPRRWSSRFFTMTGLMANQRRRADEVGEKLWTPLFPEFFPDNCMPRLEIFILLRSDGGFLNDNVEKPSHRLDSPSLMI